MERSIIDKETCVDSLFLEKNLIKKLLFYWLILRLRPTVYPWEFQRTPDFYTQRTLAFQPFLSCSCCHDLNRESEKTIITTYLTLDINSDIGYRPREGVYRPNALKSDNVNDFEMRYMHSLTILSYDKSWECQWKVTTWEVINKLVLSISAYWYYNLIKDDCISHNSHASDDTQN